MSVLPYEILPESVGRWHRNGSTPPLGNVAVIGAGLAGLSVSMMLARRGYFVTILERDCEPLSPIPSGPWSRPGIGQAAQTHSFLARSSEVLREELPDVLEQLEKNCVVDRMIPLGDDQLARPMAARRLAYELVLRTQAARDPRIDLRLGWTCTGLLSERGTQSIRINGVRLRDRSARPEDFPVDLVIDASGRKSKSLEMLRSLGACSLLDEVHTCDFLYLTRWYRVRDSLSRRLVNPVRGQTCFGGYLLCPADRDHLSLSLFMSVEDGLRKTMRRGPVFDAFAMSVPKVRQWLHGAWPTGEILPFAGIENRRRSLVGEGGGPPIGGLLLVGDAAMHTNPTLGRGTSLAFLQAQFIARNIQSAITRPFDFAALYEAWLRERPGYWFDTQVATDNELCARLRALASGKPPPPPLEQTRRAMSLHWLAQSDPVAALSWHRQFNMLTRLSDALEDPEIKRRLDTLPSEQKNAAPPEEGVNRAVLVRMIEDGVKLVSAVQ